MRRLIACGFLCAGLVLAQKKTIFQVTVICPDAGGLAPTTTTYIINAPNMHAASGMAMAQFKKDHAAHRSHKQGIYEIVAVQ
jgi:hypothetical protein